MCVCIITACATCHPCSPSPSLPACLPACSPACPQLLRGLATGMKVPEFSSAAQWKPYAQQASRQLRGTPLPASLSAHVYALGGGGGGGEP